MTITPVVVFPEAVMVAIDGLAIARAEQGWVSSPIGSDVPRPRPDVFTTIRRSGGVRRDVLTDQAQLTVDSWAQTKADAHDLAQRNRALLHSLRGMEVDGVAVYKVTELSGPARLPDSESNQERYRQNIVLDLRGAAP